MHLVSSSPVVKRSYSEGEAKTGEGSVGRQGGRSRFRGLGHG